MSLELRDQLGQLIQAGALGNQMSPLYVRCESERDYEPTLIDLSHSSHSGRRRMWLKAPTRG